MPGPKRAAKIEAKRKRLLTGNQSSEQPPTEVLADDPQEAIEDNYETSYDNNTDEDEDLNELSKDELKDLADEQSVASYGTKPIS